MDKEYLLGDHWIYQFVNPTDHTLFDRAWTDDENEIGQRHEAYLAKAVAVGKVLMAGRGLDFTFPGVVILKAKSREEAETFMNNDPFIKEGLIGGTAHPFRIALIGSNPVEE